MWSIVVGHHLISHWIRQRNDFSDPARRLSQVLMRRMLLQTLLKIW